MRGAAGVGRSGPGVLLLCELLEAGLFQHPVRAGLLRRAGANAVEDEAGAAVPPP